MHSLNLLKASDVGKMRQNPQVIFSPDTFRTSILSCDCSLRAMQAGRGGSVCAGVWARRGAHGGVPVKEVRLFWSFKLQSLKLQLVRNGKKQQFEHLWDIFTFQ